MVWCYRCLNAAKWRIDFSLDFFIVSTGTESDIIMFGCGLRENNISLSTDTAFETSVIFPILDERTRVSEIADFDSPLAVISLSLIQLSCFRVIPCSSELWKVSLYHFHSPLCH